MKLYKRAISFFLMVGISISFVPNTQYISHAFSMPVNISVGSYSNGTLNIQWPLLQDAKSIRITYNTPNNGQQVITSDNDLNSYQITGLQNDIIYDIYVEIFDDVFAAPGKNKIGEGLLYFLPRISFLSTQVEKEREALDGGGFESGAEPEINLSWAMPKVWDGTDFVYANGSDALNYMENSINSIYDNSINIDKLNFRINISSQLSNINSGPDKSSLNVTAQGMDYLVNVAGEPSVTAEVRDINPQGMMSFNMLGRKDLNSEIETNDNNVLPNNEILPGSVYYMNIRLNFLNSNGNSVGVVSSGAPSAMNASLLMGANSYTYTPIRFQISRDAYNDIYIKIFKVNQGGLDMPRIFYEVQVSSDPNIVGDWPVKKVVDGSFFPPGTEDVTTIISDISPTNEMFYKIVARTESFSDRLESSKMSYTPSEDSSRAPMPRNLHVSNVELVTREVNDELQVSSNVTISWEKPPNWDELKNNQTPDEDITYHILMNTTPSEIIQTPYPNLESEGRVYGQFPLIYRRVLFFSSKEVVENGDFLEYTIKGFDLFKGTYFSAMDGQDVIISEEILDNDESYPDFLLPNKPYFIQMYTTKGVDRHTQQRDKKSDNSSIISFTTKTISEREVPLPKDLRVNRVEAEEVGEEVENLVELQFDKIQIDWKNYMQDTGGNKEIHYDIYMSVRPEENSFVKIASTEEVAGDVLFIGYDQPNSTSIRTIIQRFSNGTDPYTIFGETLKSNTVYYFRVKTRLVADNLDDDKSSQFTPIVPILTHRLPIDPIDESEKEPIAPIDFSIAKDDEGNDIISAAMVKFEWERKSTNVYYNIIATSERVDPNATLDEISLDNVYQSFNATFGELILDPTATPLEENFEHNEISNICNYTVDKWLFPNRVYYFSIRAVNKSNPDKYSSWVSIPITTLMIEEPENLKVITEPEIRFFWTDNDINTRIEDYRVYIKGKEDLGYKLVPRTRTEINKLGDAYYTRVRNLDFNSLYDVRVYKGINNSTLVLEETDLITRNQYNEIEVSWKGKRAYNYQIEIKSLMELEYTTLTSANLKSFEDVDGNISPYYLENIFAGDDLNFYARITSIPTIDSQGNTINEPLRSNTQYQIRVRAIKQDEVDPQIESYSRFVGPVSTRTEFNQEEYDADYEKEKIEVNFLNQVDKLESTIYWRIFLADSNHNKLLLKGDKFTNALLNTSTQNFIFDISGFAAKADKDIIYMPKQIVNTMNQTNRSITIRTFFAEFTIRPDSFKTDESLYYTSLIENNNVKDLYYKIEISRENDIKVEDNFDNVTLSNELNVNILGSSQSDKQVNDLIKDTLYKEDTGLVHQALSTIEDLTTQNAKLLSGQLLYDLERELSNYIGHLFEGGNSGVNRVILGSRELRAFNSPLLVNLIHRHVEEMREPYVKYKNEENWIKLTNGVSRTRNATSFNVSRPGKYIIVITSTIKLDNLAGHWSSGRVQKFNNLYDLREIFLLDTEFNPDENVTTGDVLRIYEEILGLSKQNSGDSIRNRAERSGLNNIIRMTNGLEEINREQLAKISINMYSIQTGVEVSKLRPTTNILFMDVNDISNESYIYVVMSINMDIIFLDEYGYFNPNKKVSRAEFLHGFVRVFELTGLI